MALGEAPWSPCKSFPVSHPPFWCQTGPRGPPGHRGLSVPHFSYVRLQPPWPFLSSKGQKELLIKEGASRKPPEARLRGQGSSSSLGDPTTKDPVHSLLLIEEEKGAAEDEMVGWHHQLKWHEFEQTPGESKGEGILACCSPWSCKEQDLI